MTEVQLDRIARELKSIRELVLKLANAMHDAESEVTEKLRRFVMYMHDIHDIVYMYEERGHQAPDYVMREMERCDDRLRQLLKEAHTDGGVFERVRREMAKDTENRWDHTRAICAPIGDCYETGIGQQEFTFQDGAEIAGNECGTCSGNGLAEDTRASGSSIRRPGY